MSGSHAGLRLAARDVEPGNSPEDETEPKGGNPKDKKKEDEMSETNTHTQADLDQAVANASAASAKAANDRFAAVLASEHYAGREQLAKTLLGNDKMGADDILAALAAAPAPPAPATTDATQQAAEDAGRAVMRDALAETENSDIDAGAGGGANASEQQKKRAASESVWDKANAAVGRVKKEG